MSKPDPDSVGAVGDVEYKADAEDKERREQIWQEMHPTEQTAPVRTVYDTARALINEIEQIAAISGITVQAVELNIYPSGISWRAWDKDKRYVKVGCDAVGEE